MNYTNSASMAVLDKADKDVGSENTGSRDKSYMLSRSFEDSMRMNLNHFLVESVIGSLLHPKVDTSHESIRVADLGSGTGIWAAELASRLPPSARVDAIDISETQFPPKNYRDPKMHVETHNGFEPFPKEYLGQFDVVNVRFWVSMITDDVAEKLLQNFLTLLKPGGYLQWLETDQVSVKVESRNGAPTPGCDKLVSWLKKPEPNSSFNWLVQLPKLFKRQGLRLDANETYQIPDHLRLLWGQSVLSVMKDVFSQSEHHQEYEELEDKILAEFRDGASIDYGLILLVGRKARFLRCQ